MQTVQVHIKSIKEVNIKGIKFPIKRSDYEKFEKLMFLDFMINQGLLLAILIIKIQITQLICY